MIRFLKPSAIRIDSVPVPGTGGRIGLCSCPGLSNSFGARARKLEDDLRVVREWGAEGLVTLLEQEEIELLDIRHMPQSATHHGLWWRHLPIRDMCPPDERFDAAWAVEGLRVRDILEQGGRVVFHCWAGLGRTGTVAARLLVEFGLDPAVAIDAVREARPGSIQSFSQELYVQRLRPPE